MEKSKRSAVSRLLVANRGEIALRIVRTCREMSVATVAVYSEADEDSPHVLAADQAYCIGPPPARSSYLDIGKIVGVARTSGCDAVHPGYGFLAENAAFAVACRAAGLTFVGPPAAVIERMGDKNAARAAASACGVPVVPGTTGSVDDDAGALEAAGRLGYPVLVKAARGGGGKGMRVVRDPLDLPRSRATAASEAGSSFGDSTVYLEKYLEAPRHIEIQILADTYGRVVAVGERECSIQRRHQKLVEEAPSPAVGDDLRRRMGEAAVNLARTVGYQGAGTVEFLVDSGAFYFLEMNTRLQVEHPVTEMVTGLDLVAEQIRIARGEALDLSDPVPGRGHAIECRICAEDPFHGFIPCPGRIEDLALPEGPFVRNDCGVRPGNEVTSFYDPMIGKLIVWGADRSQAIRRMRRALGEYIVVGLQTNIPFHIGVAENSRFARGEVSTRFVEEEFRGDSFDRGDPATAALIACVLAEETKTRARPSVRGDGSSRWRMAARRGGLR